MLLFEKTGRFSRLSRKRQRAFIVGMVICAAFWVLRPQRDNSGFIVKYFPPPAGHPPMRSFAHASKHHGLHRPLHHSDRSGHDKHQELIRRLCKNPQHLGDGYGGWTICEPPGGNLRGSLVYTVGIGRNIKWDEDMITKFGTIHHGWDPTPSASEFFETYPIPRGFTFHKYGLGVADEVVTVKLPVGNNDSYTIMEYGAKAKDSSKIIQVPVLTIETMMNMQGHEKLAILKIDIEGAEFKVIDNWASRQYRPPVTQILFEFHERYFTKKTTPGNIQPRMLVPRAIKQMRSIGFEMLFKHHWVRSLYPFFSLSLLCSFWLLLHVLLALV